MSTPTATSADTPVTVPLLSADVQQAILAAKIERNENIIAAVAVQIDQIQNASGALQKQLNDNDATIVAAEKRIQRIDAKNHSLKVVLGLMCVGFAVVVGVVSIVKWIKP